MHVAFYRTYNEDSIYQKSLPPLGIGYLLSYIKQKRPEIALSFSHTFDEIIAVEPNVVCISSATENFPSAISMATRIKQALDVPVIIGGMHITSLPHNLPTCFDVGIIGEGELTIVELLDALESGVPNAANLGRIEGICFHSDGEVVVNSPRALIDDLDILPFPDRETVATRWVLSPREQIHMITSRGCPYDCSFCAASKLWQRYRFFSVDYVVAEVEYLMEKYYPEEIFFFDDLFIGNMKRFKQICDQFRTRGFHKKIVFRSYARVDLIDDDLCRLFNSMNFRYIDLGIEADNETALRFLNKRNVTPEKNQKALDCLARHNISIGVNIIIASPPETAEDIEKTYDFVRRNKDIIDRISFGPLSPIPATKIWDYALERNAVSEDMDWDRFSYDAENFDVDKYPFISEHISRQQLTAFQKKFLELANPIIKEGYLKYLDAKASLRKRRIDELDSELKTLKGSRIIQIAQKLREFFK